MRVSRKVVVFTVGPLDCVSGAESVAIDLCRSLDRNRYEAVLLSLVATQDRLPDRISEGAVARLRATGIPVEGVVIRGFRDLSGMRRFVGKLRALRPGIVHAHNRPIDYWTVAAASLARVPVRLYTRHLTYPDLSPGQRRRYRWASSRCACVLAVSEAVRQHLIREEGVPSARAVRIYNGVAPEKAENGGEKGADRHRARRDLEIGPTDFVSVSVGRIVAQKSYESLIEAARIACRASSRPLFLIVGDGPERASLVSLSRAAGVDDRVRFLGSRQDVPAILRAADMFLMTSLYEGLPLALLEAMLAGLPVVAPNIGAFPEVVLDGRTGFLPTPSAWRMKAIVLDPRPFAEAVLRFCSDPALARRMGEAGRERVARQFSRDRMISAHAELYDSLLAHARIPSFGRRDSSDGRWALAGHISG